MSERMTERARQVMALANQEALHLHHAYIGPEHILLGIVKEGNGIAANVLKGLDLDLNNVRKQVESMLTPGSDTAAITKLPQTPSARKIFDLAIQEARGLHHSYVGTEHLLLGLILESENIAAQALNTLGADLPAVREEMMMLLGPEAAVPTDGSGQLIRRAVECLLRARDAALAEGNNTRATELQDQAWNIGTILTRSPNQSATPTRPAHQGALIKCPDAPCGHWNEPLSKFCSQCGRGLQS